MKLSFDKLTPKRKLILLIALACLGVLLVVIGTAGTDKEKTEENQQATAKDASALAYIERIENRIRTIAEQITGSDEVSVMVTVASGSEYVYVSNETESGTQSSKEYITVRTENGAGELILLQEIYPEIQGVSVVCRGGDSSAIQAKLIRVIATALDIPSNRICIVGNK